jgi:hypothetical protein
MAGRFTKGAIPRREMMAEAKRHGWTYEDMGNHYGHDWQCKNCKNETWLK